MMTSKVLPVSGQSKFSAGQWQLYGPISSTAMESDIEWVKLFSLHFSAWDYFGIISL